MRDYPGMLGQRKHGFPEVLATPSYPGAPMAKARCDLSTRVAGPSLGLVVVGFGLGETNSTQPGSDEARNGPRALPDLFREPSRRGPLQVTHLTVPRGWGASDPSPPRQGGVGGEEEGEEEDRRRRRKRRSSSLGMSIRSHFGSKPLRGGPRRLSVNLGDRGDDGFLGPGPGFSGVGDGDPGEEEVAVP